MKVLHISNHFWPSTGGVEKFILDLCRESGKAGVETEVLCLNSPHHSKEVLPSSGEIDGIRITRVPYLNLKYYKAAWLPLEKLKSADIVHVHGVSALLDFVVLTKPLHKKPIVVSTHGGIFHTTNQAFLKKLYFFGFERQVLKGVDRIVACSRNDFDLFRPIADEKIVLIENGVDITRFSSCRISGKRENVFLFVGRLSRNKQVEKLIEAFSVLSKNGIRFELRIVGEDWEGIRPGLEETAKKNGISDQTVFVGKVTEEQLLQEYCQAEFFVSASRYEGFGISAIEAMAAGCIPIVNNIDSFRNFLSPPKDGFLVDFEDSGAASKAIAQIVKSDVDPIRSAAMDRAKSFSWEEKMPAWKSVYDKLGGK